MRPETNDRTYRTRSVSDADILAEFDRLVSDLDDSEYSDRLETRDLSDAEFLEMTESDDD